MIPKPLGSFLLRVLGVTLLLPVWSWGADASLLRWEHQHPTMGTVFTFVAYAPDEERARAAFADAGHRLDALNASLSDYLPESEVTRLSEASGGGEWRLLLPDVSTVLSYGQTLAAQSGGAFDMTVGPLTRLWRVARRQGKLPSAARLEAARHATGFGLLELQSQRARLTRPHMRLDLGGIAKGYAVDEAVQTLQEHGIQAALVDGGGDLFALGTPPGEPGWRITVEDLQTEAPSIVRLRNLAMATSGDLYQSLQLDGREFSHLIDPKTGLGLEFRRTVTVIARSAMQADALASALSVLPPPASEELLQRHHEKSAAGRILTRSDDRLEQVIVGDERLAALLP